MSMKTMSRVAKNFAATNGRVPVGKAVAAPEVVAVPVVVPAVAPVVEATPEPVIPAPVVPEPARKKVRFVRARAESKPAVAAVALPDRSTKAGGKLMSRNLLLKPKDGRTGKPEGKRTGKIK